MTSAEILRRLDAASLEPPKVPDLNPFARCISRIVLDNQEIPILPAEVWRE